MRYLSPAVLFFLLLASSMEVSSQDKQGKNIVFVDKQGVLRYTKDKSEAAFFGVNYTVPFAYGYRAVKRTGIDIEKAIDEDVYHFSRLGLDAFRVHVWDWEITDSLGNLLENEHLRLFDYLLAKLKERNIKTLITPIAFWGNGYPERDEPTRSFANVYGKGPSVVNEKAIQAQENYMRQFFQHVNPYTKLSYKNDPDVIAMEINNEPHHSGPKEKTTEYINRLATATKSTGWNKPIFYNISESPTYADAVAKAAVDGHSFQWYPTALVANRTQQGNFLPHVDRYRIPFIDTIPAFKNRVRMVYEFDAGDVLQSNMYPAMARSFRTAGMQWATQFAYDPLSTAYGNTEYQTHYVNLAYTPSKAISLMIASKAFHKLPRLKSYGTYPTDSLFDVFRVSYKEDLSEMNSEQEFYYSNTTQTNPVAPSRLMHVAGVGSSPIVKFTGYGAYFIDKIKEGVWRLEVMPDALHVLDPFARASPNKTVTRIHWQEQQMQVTIPGLGEGFRISAINEGNSYSNAAKGNTFSIQPGTYLLTTGSNSSAANTPAINEFVAPKSTSDEPSIVHTPLTEVTANKAFHITAKMLGVDTTDKVLVEVRSSSNPRWRTANMRRNSTSDFVGEVPADIVAPGLLNYRIILQRARKDTFTFPGGSKGNPYAWDYYQNESYQTFVASEGSGLELFNPLLDRGNMNVYNQDWRNISIQTVTGENPRQLIWKASVTKGSLGQMVGWQLFVRDKLRGRQSEVDSFDRLVIRARTPGSGQRKMRVGIITTEGFGFSLSENVEAEFKNIEIPISSLKEDSILLLPRPYPGFQPLWFKAAGATSLKLSDIDKLEVLFTDETTTQGQPYSVEVESVWLQKRK